jgi:hypothetical protein
MDHDFIEDVIVDQTSAFDRNQNCHILRGIGGFLASTKSYQTPQGVFGGLWLTPPPTTPKEIRGRDTSNSNPDLDSKTVSHSNRTRNPTDSGEGHQLREQGPPMVREAYAPPNAHNGNR